jgi:hypothetical protein
MNWWELIGEDWARAVLERCAAQQPALKQIAASLNRSAGLCAELLGNGGEGARRLTAQSIAVAPQP